MKSLSSTGDHDYDWKIPGTRHCCSGVQVIEEIAVCSISKFRWDRRETRCWNAIVQKMEAQFALFVLRQARLTNRSDRCCFWIWNELKVANNRREADRKEKETHLSIQEVAE